MSAPITRRQFVQALGIAGLGLLAGCGRLPWQAEPARLYRIGVLSAETPAATAPSLAAFRQGLQELGYAEGANVALEVRWAEGHVDRLAHLAAELVGLPLDVLVAYGDTAIRSLQEAGSQIPIVIGFSSDPVEQGFVASLARPGGNLTGLSFFSRELSAKRLELLRDTVPNAARVGFLLDAQSPGPGLAFREAEAAAQRLGVDLQVLEVRSAGELANAFDAANTQGVDALIVAASGLTASHRAGILDQAAQQRLPAMYHSREAVEAGGLMSYGPNVPAVYRRSAYYVDRILRGAKPADLPVEQPMTFEFVVNLKTARELGITIPHEIMLQVTEVIQ